jgi:ABC-2 type transport system ATP-binding protein
MTMCIRINNLTKFYGDKCAVNKVSFDVKIGEIFGLLGPNGAGKTTIIKILTFLSKPTSGNTIINNLDTAKKQESIKKIIAVVPQEKNYERELSVYDNMLVYGMLYGISPLEQKIEEKLLELGLSDERDTAAETLSGGMQRRLLIARALLSEPKILFLDEPTIGLDPQVRRNMWDIIRGLRNNGRTIFMTSHYIEEVEKLCDRVGILSKGQLVAIDTPSNLKNGIGEYVVDIQSTNGKMESIICQSRQEADDVLRNSNNGGAIRHANLEDVFIKFTGEPIDR